MLVVIVDVLAEPNRCLKVEVACEAEGKMNHGPRIIHMVAFRIEYSMYKIHMHCLSSVESAWFDKVQQR
jgi:hypothetical protein